VNLGRIHVSHETVTTVGNSVVFYCIKLNYHILAKSDTVDRLVVSLLAYAVSVYVSFDTHATSYMLLYYC